MPSNVSYNKNLFSPTISEANLSEGKGLTKAFEQQEYEEFARLNELVLERYFDDAVTLRTSADKAWISQIQHKESSTKENKF